MKKILIIGSNSDIAKELVKEKNYNFIKISSKDSNFNILDKLTFPKVDKIDGLVYFPGTINLKPFNNYKEQDFQFDYEVNVIGLINILQFYHKSFNINSSIVTISSIAASFGMPFHSSISMCKASVEALTKSLAAEWAPKIRLNCIAPSLVSSKLSERLINSESKIENIKQKHPLKNIGETNDISNIISFLLSDKAKWMTGQIIRVDGGLSYVR
ncbi:MAG: oxidoreductase [Flavobacteriales bacterium]|nr:oxidoreductase [Flavobacteriales bacterium]|tara:strand:- start:16669 stop:17310 length:642 start_codon:yes stop_codon:yes gene_type:complete